MQKKIFSLLLAGMFIIVPAAGSMSVEALADEIVYEEGDAPGGEVSGNYRYVQSGAVITNFAEGYRLNNNNRQVIYKNSGTIGENYGVVGISGDDATQSAEGQGNAGTIELNGSNSMSSGYVTRNDGTIEKNCYGRVFYNYGTIVENNTPLDDEYYKVYNNESTGTVTTNNGTVDKNNGTVTTNNGVVKENNGTVTTNNGVVKENNGTVAANLGTVKLNSADGVVVNDTQDSETGLVEVNRGGKVQNGIIDSNFGDSAEGTDASVNHQYWKLSSECLDDIGIVRGARQDSYINEATEDGYTIWVQANETNGTLHSIIISANDPSLRIQSIELLGGAEGIATITRNSNGTWTISNIAGNINILPTFGIYVEEKPVVFYGAPVEIDVDNSVIAVPLSNSEDTPVEQPVPVVLDITGKPVPATVSAYQIKAEDVQGIADAVISLSSREKIAVSDVKIVDSYAFSGKKNVAMVLNVANKKFEIDDEVYVIFKEKLTGKTAYVKAVVNANGTISFVIPFDDCTMTVIKADRKSSEKKSN